MIPASRAIEKKTTTKYFRRAILNHFAIKLIIGLKIEQIFIKKF